MRESFFSISLRPVGQCGQERLQQFAGSTEADIGLAFKQTLPVIFEHQYPTLAAIQFAMREYVIFLNSFPYTWQSSTLNFSLLLINC